MALLSKFGPDTIARLVRTAANRMEGAKWCHAWE